MSDSRATPRGLFFSDDALPLGVPARTYRRELNSDNGTTGFGPSNNQIRIPLNVAAFIDTQLSYLMFDFQLTLPDTSAAIGKNCPNKDVVFEGGCWAVFNRMQVLGPDASVIEDMQYYNRLYNMLVKCQTGPQFSQTILQAIAGAPGHTTNPVSVVSHGGDLAVPFNPRGRHSQTKSLLGVTKDDAGKDLTSANFINPTGISDLGPLAEYRYTLNAANQAQTTITPQAFAAKTDRLNACSIESAGVEQWGAWWAGLGTSSWAKNPLQNTWQGYITHNWTLGTGHAFLAELDGTNKQVQVGTAEADIGNALGATGLVSGNVPPARACNRTAVGISGFQTGLTGTAYSNPIKALDDNTELTDKFVAGADNLNSRANPLSMPTWTGSNHQRVVGAMGNMAYGGTSATKSGWNQAFAGKWSVDSQTAAAQKESRRRILLRLDPLNDWVGTDGQGYDDAAELSYNDWFVFQHTTIRPHGPVQLTSDGTATPAPLVSYVGSDGTSLGSTKVIIRWDKAKTKGCQNLAGRLLLGHAPSAILFDEAKESRGQTGGNGDSDLARPQIIKHTFLMPLISGILNNSKYFPAQFVSGGGLVLQLHLESNQYLPFRLVADQPTRLEEAATSGFRHMSYQIDHPKYLAHCINFEDAFNKQFVAAVSAGGIIWKGQTFRAHPTTFNCNTEVVNVEVTERVTSLKGIIATFVPQIYLTGDHRILQSNSLSSYRVGINEYRYRIGAVPVPSDHIKVRPFDHSTKYPGYPFPRTDVARGASSGALYPVDFGDHYDNKSEGLTENIAEAYLQALLVFNKLSNINSLTNLLREDFERECRLISKSGVKYGTSATSVNAFDYESDFSPYDCEFQGGMFLAALNTETFIQDSGVIASGINTAANALNITLELKRKNFEANKTIQAIVYTLFDQTYSLTPQGTLVATT